MAMIRKNFWKLGKILAHMEGKKLPNLGLNSWSSLPGSYPLTIRGYERKENHEFDPRLGNFFPSI